MHTQPVATGAIEGARPLPRFSTIRVRVLAVVLLTMLPAFILIIFNTVDERTRAVEFTRQQAVSTTRLIAAEQSPGRGTTLTLNLPIISRVATGSISQ